MDDIAAALVADFEKVGPHLAQATKMLQEKGGYTHPIFIATQAPTPLGELLIEQGLYGNAWGYYATYLDFLVQKEIIHPNKLSSFLTTYKPPQQHCCLLVLMPDFMHFTYLPYPTNP